MGLVAVDDIGVDTFIVVFGAAAGAVVNDTSGSETVDGLDAGAAEVGRAIAGMDIGTSRPQLPTVKVEFVTSLDRIGRNWNGPTKPIPAQLSTIALESILVQSATKQPLEVIVVSFVTIAGKIHELHGTSSNVMKQI
jgi:hypothetical protein